MIRSRDRRSRGQALVEFSLALPIFIGLLLMVFDLGRGIYVYNGVSQAAREIARSTIVAPGSPLGTSNATQSTINVQKTLVPNLGNPTFECVDIAGAPSTNVPCTSGDYVRVTTTASYSPVLPLRIMGLPGSFTLKSTSSLEIP
jgi:Flp pilus assembly protein TadG